MCKLHAKPDNHARTYTQHSRAASSLFTHLLSHFVSISINVIRIQWVNYLAGIINHPCTYYLARVDFLSLSLSLSPSTSKEELLYVTTMGRKEEEKEEKVILLEIKWWPDWIRFICLILNWINLARWRLCHARSTWFLLHGKLAVVITCFYAVRYYRWTERKTWL